MFFKVDFIDMRNCVGLERSEMVDNTIPMGLLIGLDLPSILLRQAGLGGSREPRTETRNFYF